MAQLRGGTTIGGYTALHSGLNEAYLGGNLSVNGKIVFSTEYGGAHGIYADSSPGNTPVIGAPSNNPADIEINAAGGKLVLGGVETETIWLARNLMSNTGNKTIADTSGTLYYQGENLDSRYLKTATGSYVGLDTSGSSSYSRMVPTNAASGDWLRVPTTSGGILPYSNGNSSIGASSWKFRDMHAINFYENGSTLSSKYAAAVHNHDYQQHKLTDSSNAITASGDWNNYANTGFYMGSGLTNQPTDGSGMHTWKYALVQQHNSTYATQLTTDFNGKEMHFRAKLSSSWQSWNKLWHSGNFDPGTQLSKSGDSITGKIYVGSSSTRDAGMYGTYSASYIGHVWSMGTQFSIPASGANFGDLYGMAYKHTNNTTGGTMAGGHQIVFTQNGVPGASIGLGGNIWTSGSLILGGSSMRESYAGNIEVSNRLTVSSTFYGSGGIVSNSSFSGDGAISTTSNLSAGGNLDIVGTATFVNDVVQVKTVESYNHAFLKMGKTGFKGLNGSFLQLQCRNYTDASWIPIAASEFTTASRRAWKKNIEPYEQDALEKIMNTQIYQYHYNEESDSEMKHLGMIYEESPVEIVSPAGEGIVESARISLGWKAIQDLNRKLEAENTALRDTLQSVVERLDALDGKQKKD